MGLFRPATAVVPVGTDLLQRTSLCLGGQYIDEGERDQCQGQEDPERHRATKGAKGAEEDDPDDEVGEKVCRQHGRAALGAQPDGEGLGGVDPDQRTVAEVEAYREE